MNKETVVVGWDRDHLSAMVQEIVIPPQSFGANALVDVAVMSAITEKRPEVDAPDIWHRSGTAAIWREMMYFDHFDHAEMLQDRDVLRNQSLLDRLGLPFHTRFSSVYMHGVVVPKTEVYFPDMEVVVAERLSGEVPESGPKYPAVNPKLTMDQIKACFYLLSAPDTTSFGDINHVLSVAELARVLGRSVITSAYGDVLQLEFLKTPLDKSGADTELLELYGYLGDIERGGVLEVFNGDDDAAVMVRVNKNRWMRGAVYRRASEQKRFKPPGSSITLPLAVSEGGRIIYFPYQIGCYEEVLTAEYAVSLEVARGILGAAMTRVFTGEKAVSEILKEVVAAQVEFVRHSKRSNLSAIRGFTRLLGNLTRRALAGEVPEDRIKAELENVATYEGTVNVNVELTAASDTILEELAGRQPVMGAINIGEVLEEVVGAAPLLYIKQVGLRPQDLSRIDLRLVSALERGTHVLEFYGVVHAVADIILHNSFIQARRTEWLSKEGEGDNMQMRILLLEEEHEGVEYIRVYFLDNLGGMSSGMKQSVLDEKVPRVESESGGKGLKHVREIARFLAPSVDEGTRFVLENGLPDRVAGQLREQGIPKGDVSEIENLPQGLCVGIIFPKTSPPSS